jgi:hypothetical protein
MATPGAAPPPAQHHQHQQHRAKKAKKARKEKPVLAEAVAGASAGNSKFARALGSTDYLTREKGLQALQGWLCLRSDLGELDMLKIWKGLFFCFWHSDKAPVQVRPRRRACAPWGRGRRGGECSRTAARRRGQRPPRGGRCLRSLPSPPPPTPLPPTPRQADLAQRLAGLLPRLPPPTAALYFDAFLVTMRREWFAIDYHRLDKYLMLVRRVLAAVLCLLRDSRWCGGGCGAAQRRPPPPDALLLLRGNALSGPPPPISSPPHPPCAPPPTPITLHRDPELVTHYAGMLQARVLAPPQGASGRGAGLVYHICDIFIPELRNAAGGAAAAAAAPSAPPALAGRRPKGAEGAAAGSKRGRGEAGAGGAQVPAAAVEALLAPFVEALKIAPEKAAILRIRCAALRAAGAWRQHARRAGRLSHLPGVPSRLAPTRRIQMGFGAWFPGSTLPNTPLPPGPLPPPRPHPQKHLPTPTPG